MISNLLSLKLRLKIYKRMEQNNHKENRNEWNVFINRLFFKSFDAIFIGNVKNRKK